MDLVLPIIVGVLIAGIALLAYGLYKLKQAYDCLSAAFDSKTSELAALCSAALIQDQRIYNLEEKLRMAIEVEGEQDYGEAEIDLDPSGEDSYQSAIQGIKQGVDAQQLVDQWGMSRDEADLLVRLHGGA